MAAAGILLVVFLDAALRLLAPSFLALHSAPPDLPLLTAFFFGFRARNVGQLHYALLLGAAMDCFSSAPLGHFAFLYGVGAYLAFRIRRYLPPDAGLSYGAASLFCGFAVACAALALAVLAGVSDPGAGLARALERAFFSALLAPFYFPLLLKSRLFRRAFSGPRYEFVP